MDRNLMAQKFIQKIIYSSQNIKISLFYPEGEQAPYRAGSEIIKNFSAIKNPARQKAGGLSWLCPDKENSVLRQNKKFVASNAAAGPGFEPGYPLPKSGVLPLDDPARVGLLCHFFGRL